MRRQRYPQRRGLPRLFPSLATSSRRPEGNRVLEILHASNLHVELDTYLFSYVKKMIYIYSVFLSSSLPREYIHPLLSFSPQSLSLQFHSRGIETAAGASSRIDKTMAIARVSRRFSMPLEFYAQSRGWYLLTSNHAPKLLLPLLWIYTTNVSLEISQAHKNPLVTERIQNYFQVSRHYLENVWLLISDMEKTIHMYIAGMRYYFLPISESYL